jgi:hypothetical protein
MTTLSVNLNTKLMLNMLDINTIHTYNVKVILTCNVNTFSGNLLNIVLAIYKNVMEHYIMMVLNNMSVLNSQTMPPLSPSKKLAYFFKWWFKHGIII